MKISGLHIVIAIAVLGAIGEYTSGWIRRIAWTVTALIVALHTLRVWSSG